MHVDTVFGAIGRWAVRLRWLILLVWVFGAIAAVTQLPALSSVTQSNNSKFLPASAPSQHAIDLSAPFGSSNLLPIPVIAATTSGPLTAADISAVSSLQSQFHSVPGIQKVLDVGRSANGQAEQLLALAANNSGNQNYQQDLIDGMRAKIASAALPAGLRVHLAGSIAVQVDQQKASGNTGNKVQDLSLIFIIVLLVLIFRSLTLAIVTVLPALLSVLISGPLVAEAAKHGLQVSPLAQFLLIVLVLGAGTDYGLFLVFRVREELRAAGHDVTGMAGGARAGPVPVPALGPGRTPPGGPGRAGRVGDAGRRVDHVLGRHSDRGGADPAGGQLPVLLQPRHPVRHRDRGHPAGRPHAAARAAVDPPVAAGHEAHAVQGHVRPAQATAVEHPGQRGGRRLGPGGRPHRAPPRDHAGHRRGGVRRPGPGRPRLHRVRLRRQHGPAGLAATPRRARSC